MKKLHHCNTTEENFSHYLSFYKKCLIFLLKIHKKTYLNMFLLFTYFLDDKIVFFLTYLHWLK